MNIHRLFFYCVLVGITQLYTSLQATAPGFLLEEALTQLLPPDPNKPWSIEQNFEYIKQHDTIFGGLETKVSRRVTEKLSIQTIVPFWVINTLPPNLSTIGISDILIRIKYLTVKMERFLVFTKLGVTFPSGSIKHVPVTGAGSYGFFGELSGSNVSPDWYVGYRFYMLLFSRAAHKFKLGNNFLYEIASGRVIKFKQDSKSTLYFIMQLTFYDFLPNRVAGIDLPNTGSFVAFLGPLIAWTRDDFLLQGLLQLPIGQYLNGNQQPYDLRAVLDFQIRF